MKITKLTRALSFERAAVDDADSDADSDIIEFPFSSEQPVSRWFGDEVLSHDNKAVDLKRLNDGAPLLFNHNPNDVIGVVESARIGADKRGYAKVRFSKNDRAQGVKRDVQDGIMRNVSVGYRIHEMTEAKKDKTSTFTASRWQPLEVSIVGVPADQSVGIGRADDEEALDVIVHRSDESPAAAAASAQKGNDRMNQNTTAAAPVDVAAIQAEGAAAERTRIASITAMGDKFSQGDLARNLIERNVSLADAREAFLDKLGARKVTITESENSQVVDLSEKEKRQYSVVRAINAAINKDWRAAGFEKECSDTVAKRAGRDTMGFFMPLNIVSDPDVVRSVNENRATYATGATGTGGALVANNLLAGSFIEVLRNKAKVMQMGARMLSGLQGNVTIPRQISQTTAYWVTEGTAVTEAEATFDTISLSPKTIGALSLITRQMLMQSTPDIDVLVREDLAAVLALGIDQAAINGTGTGVPTGILNVSGIGSVIGGTVGAAITIDHMIALETALAASNAPEDTLSYLCNYKTVGALKTLKSTTGQYLWTQLPNGGRGVAPGEINGYPVARSNQMPSNGTKSTGSNLSSLIFGAWSELLIGEWGVLEILPNPYGTGFTAGSYQLRALQSVDIQVRHAASFSAMTDAIA